MVYSQPKNFITDKNVKPLLISVYIHRSCYKHFKSKKIRNYLIKNGPVGCRDMSTLKFLESINVPAYFSSCLSLTLIPNPDIVKKEYVLTVGLTKEQEDYIQSKTSRQVYSIERNVPLIYNTKTRFEMAKTFLALYQSAHCIITNRLHVAMPALALNTPVLLVNIEKDNLEYDPERFDGVEDFFNNVDIDDFINGDFSYDFENPPQNPKKFEHYRNLLINKCTEFTGIDNVKTLIPTEEPINKLLQYFTKDNYLYNCGWFERILFIIDKNNLLKTYLKRLFELKNFYDLK